MARRRRLINRESLSKHVDPRSLAMTPGQLSSDEPDRPTGAVLGKNIWGAWPLIIWEATTAKRYYYGTNITSTIDQSAINI